MTVAISKKTLTTRKYGGNSVESFPQPHHTTWEGLEAEEQREPLSNDQLSEVTEVDQLSDTNHKNSLSPYTDTFVFDKLFSNVLKPSKLQPFYYRSKGVTKNDDITVTSLITVDRFDILLNNMLTYEGPFSVALHILDDNKLNSHLSKLNNFLEKYSNITEYRLDLHLIIDKYPRQFNYFRNVARFFSKTELVLPLDIDFIINKNFLKHFAKNEKLKEKLKNEKAVFILPAFEFTKDLVDTKYLDFPQTKEEITHLFGENFIVFHGNSNEGHTSTKYDKWFQSNEMYTIQPFSTKYEPYAVFNSSQVPWSDERFTGYGANKAAWWYEIYLAGLEFWILPDDFVIHQYHKYNDAVRHNE
ncbi:hypothetical protein HK099_005980, partial [Clydaea vesicula]